MRTPTQPKTAKEIAQDLVWEIRLFWQENPRMVDLVRPVSLVEHALIEYAKVEREWGVKVSNNPEFVCLRGSDRSGVETLMQNGYQDCILVSRRKAGPWEEESQ